MVNVLYTIVGQPFADWVQHHIDERNEKLAREQNLNIELDPEIAAAFRASSQISSKSHKIHSPTSLDINILMIEL